VYYLYTADILTHQ